MVGVSRTTDAHTLAILCSMEEESGSVMVALCVQFCTLNQHSQFTIDT